MTRATRDNYYLRVAQEIASRSTCLRAKVGCIIVNKHDDPIALGYNGAPRKLPHCTDVGCLIINNHCVRTVHAEVNALIRAGRLARGCTLYANLGPPCFYCTKLVINAGIMRVVYSHSYLDDLSSFCFDWLRQAEIEVVCTLTTGSQPVDSSI